MYDVSVNQCGFYCKVYMCNGFNYWERSGYCQLSTRCSQMDVGFDPYGTFFEMKRNLSYYPSRSFFKLSVFFC